MSEPEKYQYQGRLRAIEFLSRLMQDGELPLFDETFAAL